MSKASKAAALWARLEPVLEPFLKIEILLERDRAAIIRACGDALDGVPVPEPAPVPMKILKPLRETPANPQRPALVERRARAKRQVSPTISPEHESAITRRLDQLLDVQCGYSNSDRVDYR